MSIVCLNNETFFDGYANDSMNAAPPYSPASNTTDLVILDSRVEDLNFLIEGLRPHASHQVIDVYESPLDVLHRALLNQYPLNVLHVVSHGKPGELVLGNGRINSAYLRKHASALEKLKSLLSDDSQILLYGCEVGKGTIGRQFLRELEIALEIPVMASTTLTGSVHRGGDWEFDVARDVVKPEIVFSDKTVQLYEGVFADPVITISDTTVLESNSTFSPGMGFVVTLSEAATTDVFIDYQTINGTAKEEYDVDQTRNTLTIAAGETTGVITITAFGGTEIEADESFALELTNPRGAVFADDAVSLRAAGTILDNDGTGNKLALFVDDVRVVEGDSGTREAVFLVRLSQAPASSITLDYTTSDGSALAGEDYVAQAGSLTFTPGGDLVQEVRVDLLGDTAVELSETFNLTFSPTTAIANGAQGAAGMATILDDDADGGTQPVLSLSSAEVLESNSTFSPTMEFVVTLSEVATTDVVVDYQTVNGTAKEEYDVDQTRLSGQLVIAAGETSGVIAITTFGGTEVEPDESFVLELTNVQGAVFAGDATRLQAQGVMLDNDGGGNKLALLVGDAQVVEGDSGSREAVFEVRLSRPAEEAITLSYTTRDATARAGEDYTAMAGTVTFLAGETVKSVAVVVQGDATVEGTEQFSLVFTPTTEIANGVQGAEGIATILDDDAGSGVLPVLSLSSAEVVESNSTFSPTMEFVVTLSQAATTDVVVDYQTVNGTAKEEYDVDQTRQLGQLVIAAGETSGVIAITTFGGTEVEPDESFVLELTNVQGAVFAGDATRLQAQGVMLDNDGGGSKLALLVGDAQVVEGDSGSREAVFEVRLTRPVDEAVSIHYTTAPGTAGSGSDFAPVTGTLTFLAGQTIAAVHVPVFGDTATEASEQFSLVLSAPQGGVFGSGGAGAEGTATILDDDAGGGSDPVISIAPAEVVESNSTFSPTMEFVVTLSAPSTDPVRVDFTTVDGTALAGSDYSANIGTLTFAPGQTSAVVTVTTFGGTVEEPDETFALRLTNPQNAALAGGVTTLDGIGTILDNDSPAPIDGLPILTVDDIQVAEQPGGSTATFTLNLSSPSAVVVSGSFAVQAGTATAGADFTASSGNFIIDPGETSITLQVPVLDDDLEEPLETFVLHITGLLNADYQGTDQELWAIGDITDDDLNPSLAVAVGGNETIAEGELFNRTINLSDAEDTDNDGWTYSIDWDNDGVDDETGNVAAGANAFDITRVFADGDAVETVRVTVEDGAGESDTGTFEITVNNVAPIADVSGADNIGEGSEFTLTVGPLIDPGNDTPTGYQIDWDDGTVQDLTPAEWTAAAGTFTHIYTDGGAGGTLRSIQVSVTDEDGTFVLGSHAVTVNNVDPSVVLDGVDSIDEGSNYSLAITGSDPAGAEDTLSYVIDWGDGSAVQNITAAELVSLGGSVEHLFADDEDGPVNATDRLIEVTVSDEDGSSSSSSRTVTVNNVAPLAVLAGAAAVDVGASYQLNIGAIIDPGTDTVTDYLVDWGDGNRDAYTALELSALGGMVEHTYSDPGDKNIAVTATDEDGDFPLAQKDVSVAEVSTSDIVRIGDAPARQLRSDPTAWEDAWSDERVSTSHKADATDANEAWSDLVFSNQASHLLAGGDILSGDLGISGQSWASGLRQEIDGTEALRFEFDQEVSRVSLDVQRLSRFDDGEGHESGRVQAFNDAGELVQEVTFVAAAGDGSATVDLNSAEGFNSIVVTSGAYNGDEFVFGAYADDQGNFARDKYAENGNSYGSDFILNALEFEFQPVTPQINAASLMMPIGAAGNGGSVESEFGTFDAPETFTDLSVSLVGHHQEADSGW